MEPARVSQYKTGDPCWRNGVACLKRGGRSSAAVRLRATTDLIASGLRAAWRKGGARGGSGTRPPSDVRTPLRMVARERSERARKCARIPRAYARGEILYTSGFLVRWLYVFLCNRVAYLLIRNLASEYIDVVLVYTHRFSIYLQAYLSYHISQNGVELATIEFHLRPYQMI